MKELIDLIQRIRVTNSKNKEVVLDKAIKQIEKLALNAAKKHNKIILIGNGGSATIASHIAVDLLKNCNIPAIAFNDAGFLTCISNDLGYEYVFQKPTEILANRGDIFFAISSSGKSKNILNAVKAAQKKKSLIITLSGFDKNNPLRKMGDINFYLPSDSYGNVEITHLIICHKIVDDLLIKSHG